MTEKDKTFQDILSELQISNKGGFNQVFQLEGIQKSLLITEQATTTSKDDTKTQNDEMVARLNDLLDNSKESLNCLTEILANTSKKKVQKTTAKDKEIAAGLSYISNYTAANGVELIAIQEYLKKIEFSNEAIMTRVGALVDAAKGGSSLKDLENNKEMLEIFKQIQTALALKKKEEEEQEQQEKPEMSLGLFSVAIGVALLGFVTGFVAELARQAKEVFRSLTKLLNFRPLLEKIKGSKFFAEITKAVKGMVQIVERFGSKMNALFQIIKRSEFGQIIIKSFDRMVQIVERFGSKMNALYEIVKRSKLSVYVTQLFQSFMNLGKGISEAFEPVIKKFNLIKRVLSIGPESVSIVGKFIKAFEDIRYFFSKIKLVSALFFRFGKAFGTFLGKLVVPITVILGIFDSITGFIDGFTKTQGNIIDKLLGGLRGGVKKFLDGLIGGIFNIMKSIVSWAAGALGFKDLEKMLDSFNFGDIIDKIGVGLGFVMKAAGGIFAALGNVGGIFGNFAGVFGAILKKIAWPITAIIGLFDLVTGFIDGFQKTEGGFIDKIIGGLKGGLSKLVDGLIGGLLNMLKSGVSWIARALGFKGIEKALDSFSFTDIIKTAISGVIDTVVTFFTDQFAFISSIFQGLGDLFNGEKDLKSIFLDVMAGLVKTLLAPLNAISGLFGFDLTKKALDLLGLPSSGGSGAAGATGAAGAAGATGAAGAEQTKGKIDLKSEGSMVPVGPSGPLNKQQSDNESDNGIFADNKIYKTVEQAEAVASSSITAAPLGASEDPFGLKSLDGLNAAISTIAQESPLSSPSTQVTDADMLDAYKQAALLDDTQDAVLNSDEELLNTYARTAQLERNDSPIVGAEMNALETNTAQTEDAYTNAANAAMISASSSGGGSSSLSRTINNNNKSITYNSNNIPDRTSWMLTPVFNY